MVDFINITFDANWIFADAFDHDFNVSDKIKVHRTEEIFETTCKVTNQFQKAAWHLVAKVNKGRIKQNGNLRIAWG